MCIVETVSGFTGSRNKDFKTLACCIITNLLRLKDGKCLQNSEVKCLSLHNHQTNTLRISTANVYEFFSKGQGKEDIISMLSATDEYLQTRTLWALSVMPPGSM
jgi:hypothetical protein